MSIYVVMTICMMVVTSCEKDDPITPSIKALTVLEQEMVGEWAHTQTLYFNILGDTITTIPPTCGSASIEFLSTEYTGTALIADYDYVDNKSCSAAQGGWYRSNDSILVSNNVYYVIEHIDSVSLTLNVQGVLQNDYYIKL